MKIYHLFILSIIVVFVACSSKAVINDDSLSGEWKCIINSGNNTGYEYLKFTKEHSFTVNDSLVFCSTDSGFEFSIAFKVHAEGSWKLKTDSIFLVYDKSTISINPDIESFVVSPIENNADTIAMNANKEQMAIDLANRLTSIYQLQFDNINEEILLGKIMSYSDDNLILENKEQQIHFSRK